MDKIDFPAPPVITKEDLKKCQETNDYCPVFFEWYKYVAELSSFFFHVFNLILVPYDQSTPFTMAH